MSVFLIVSQLPKKILILNSHFKILKQYSLTSWSGRLSNTKDRIWGIGGRCIVNLCSIEYLLFHSMCLPLPCLKPYAISMDEYVFCTQNLLKSRGPVIKHESLIIFHRVGYGGVWKRRQIVAIRYCSHLCSNVRLAIVSFLEIRHLLFP